VVGDLSPLFTSPAWFAAATFLLRCLPLLRQNAPDPFSAAVRCLPTLNASLLSFTLRTLPAVLPLAVCASRRTKHLFYALLSYRLTCVSGFRRFGFADGGRQFGGSFIAAAPRFAGTDAGGGVFTRASLTRGTPAVRWHEAKRSKAQTQTRCAPHAHRHHTPQRGRSTSIKGAVAAHRACALRCCAALRSVRICFCLAQRRLCA